MPTNCTSTIDADHDSLSDADLVAIAGRHPHDRADAIVVDEKRDEHQERLAIQAQGTAGLDQAIDRGPDRQARASGIPPARRRFADVAKERDRKDQPPDRDRQKRETTGQRALRDVRSFTAGSPNHSGLRIHARLSASRMPPPM